MTAITVNELFNFLISKFVGAFEPRRRFIAHSPQLSSNYVSRSIKKSLNLNSSAQRYPLKKSLFYQCLLIMIM